MQIQLRVNILFKFQNKAYKKGFIDKNRSLRRAT